MAIMVWYTSRINIFFFEYEIHNCVVQIKKKISYDYIAVLVLNYISNTIVLEIP